MVVNSNSARFEDEDHMVAAIRHEMVHVRLMRLTQKHLADWKQAPRGLSFMQYVDQHVGGADAALIKGPLLRRSHGEAVAYVEGFLSAFFYSPVEEPQAGDRAWISNLKGFTKEFETARLNSGPLPKDRTGLPGAPSRRGRAPTPSCRSRRSSSRSCCDAAGESRRKNLAAWA